MAKKINKTSANPDVTNIVFGSYRKRESKNRYMLKFLESDGKTFIRAYYDDISGSGEIDFGVGMTKEFFAAFKKNCL